MLLSSHYLTKGYDIMKSSELEEFFASLPEPHEYADKHLYVWGIGNTARLYQEGFAREKGINIYGYTASNITDGGGGMSSDIGSSALPK